MGSEKWTPKALLGDPNLLQNTRFENDTKLITCRKWQYQGRIAIHVNLRCACAVACAGRRLQVNCWISFSKRSKRNSFALSHERRRHEWRLTRSTAARQRQEVLSVVPLSKSSVTSNDAMILVSKEEWDGIQQISATQSDTITEANTELEARDE